MASWKVSLYANGVPVSINGYTQNFIGNAVAGMLSALKGAEEIRSARILISGDAVNVSQNDAPVKLKPFVSQFVSRTIGGMISSLEEVSNTDALEIRVVR